MIRITILEGEWEKSREFPVDVVKIGRSSENTLEIKEPSISRLHCEIAFAGGKAMLINHARTNGTLVNGRPVGEAMLKPGDEILVGRVRLRFDGAAEGSVAPAVAGHGDAAGSGSRKRPLHRRRRD
ncbi:MAG: FHA domain-containing protein [Planctomycetia bacterium]|nr:FHA domain-containing protein [Planctomycetia bacterium]